jgi:integrase
LPPLTRETAAPRPRRTKQRANGEGSIFWSKGKQLWVASCTYNGKQHQFSASIKREAIAERAAWQRHRQQGVRPTSDRLRLNDWVDQWLVEQKPRYDAQTGDKIAGLEPTTWANYERTVRRYIKPYLGSRRLHQLTADDVARWQLQLHEEGRSGEIQRSALVRLGTALKLAKRRGHVERNVASAEAVDRRHVPKPRHVHPSERDLARLLHAIRDDSLELLVYVGLGSGLRSAEAAGLRWEDIEYLDDDHAVIVAQRRVNYLGKGVGRLEWSGLKTATPSGVYTWAG